jgi:hypothetical protein
VFRELLLLRQGFGVPIAGLCKRGQRLVGFAMPKAIGTLDVMSGVHSIDHLEKWTLDVLKDLEKLHASNFVHGDIKSRNVLVFHEGAKLCDFGLATKTSDDQNIGDIAKHSDAYTINYRPPELLLGIGNVTSASDMWALGITVYECLFSLPASGCDARKSVLKELYAQIPMTFEDRMARFAAEMFETQGLVNDSLVSLMAHTLDYEPSKRSSAASLVALWPHSKAVACNEFSKLKRTVHPIDFSVHVFQDSVPDKTTPKVCESLSNVCGSLCNIVQLDPKVPEAFARKAMALTSGLCDDGNKEIPLVPRITGCITLSILLWRYSFKLEYAARMCSMSVDKFEKLLDVLMAHVLCSNITFCDAATV